VIAAQVSPRDKSGKLEEKQSLTIGGVIATAFGKLTTKRPRLTLYRFSAPVAGFTCINKRGGFT